MYRAHLLQPCCDFFIMHREGGGAIKRQERSEGFILDTHYPSYHNSVKLSQAQALTSKFYHDVGQILA